jgi:RNA polymerase sigma-70 factor (ECF subfamily)
VPTRAELPETDDALLIRARNGDREAFGELVERHQRRVWRVCRQYLGPSDAGVAAQDAWVKAYLSLPTFDSRSAFTTWLTRIAINTCLDELRRLRREGLRADGDGDAADPDPLATLPDSAAGPEELSIQRQAVTRLHALELELPDRQREIFRLRFYAELELDEIAGALGVHVGTVKTQLHRAVHRLREGLGDVR